MSRPQVKKKTKFKNAPAFRATGRGYFNAIPNFPATAKTGNMLLVNKALNSGDRNFKLWLFCTAIQTGWSIAGSYGQSAAARTYYPRNLTQGDITISGAVANQYEYDRIVEFVLTHHRTALDTFDSDTDPNTSSQDTRPVLMTLYPYLIDTGRRTRRGEIVYREVYGGLPGAGRGGSPGTQVQGYITGITAGHKKYENAPLFDLTFHVSYDFLSKPVHIRSELNKQLRTEYMQSFGRKHHYVKPSPGSGFQDSPPTDYWDNSAVTSRTQATINSGGGIPA